MRKTVATIEPEVAAADPLAEPIALAVPAAPSRFADYLELTKPRIAVMALFTVAIGYALGAGPSFSALVLLHTLVGAGLVAAGGSALNQWLERGIDSRMFRTARRPLPAGRLAPAEALVFGVVLVAAGLAYLAATTGYQTVVVAGLTGLLYVAVYTPLKTVTVWNTLVGAVPGALPPVIGWAAARGWDDPAGGLALFLILFVWQLPHFFAIAWMYRDDYARGGLRMLPILDPTGKATAAAMVLTCVALIAVGLLPALVGMAGPVYTTGSAMLGAMFLARALMFRERRTDGNARNVLRASLLHLPGTLGLLLIDRLARFGG